MKKGTKNSIQLWLAVALVVFGMALLTASFVCPPLAIIDASVLTALGEILTFAGSLIGLDYNYRLKAQKEALT